MPSSFWTAILDDDDPDPDHRDLWAMVLPLLNQIDADADAKDKPATWHWRLLYEDF